VKLNVLRKRRMPAERLKMLLSARKRKRRKPKKPKSRL